MKRNQIKQAVLEELSNIAPDIDMADFDEKADVQDEYDLDSMDAVNLLTAIHKRLKVNVPDRDYARMRSIAELVDYLEQHLN